jgi:hypothetical protein
MEKARRRPSGRKLQNDSADLSRRQNVSAIWNVFDRQVDSKRWKRASQGLGRGPIAMKRLRIRSDAELTPMRKSPNVRSCVNRQSEIIE